MQPVPAEGAGRQPAAGEGLLDDVGDAAMREADDEAVMLGAAANETAILELYRTTADHMKAALGRARGYIAATQQLVQLNAANNPRATAATARDTIMQVLRAWDSTVEGSTQQEWAAQARELCAGGLLAAGGRPLPKTRQKWWEGRQSLRSKAERAAFTDRGVNECAVRLRAVARATGGHALLVCVDPVTNQVHSFCSDELDGFAGALHLGPSMVGYARMYESRRLASALTGEHKLFFVNLSKSEQGQLCKLVFKQALGGDHRARYPFAGAHIEGLRAVGPAFTCNAKQSMAVLLPQGVYHDSASWSVNVHNVLNLVHNVLNLVMNLQSKAARTSSWRTDTRGHRMCSTSPSRNCAQPTCSLSSTRSSCSSPGM